MSASEGLRYDANKVRWDLLPYDALHEVAKVSTYGAKKYAERNWEKGMSWGKMVASGMRHLYSHMSGEKLDPETNLPHLAHFAWNALALLAYHLRGVGRDDIGDCAQGPREITANPDFYKGPLTEAYRSNLASPVRDDPNACDRPSNSWLKAS